MDDDKKSWKHIGLYGHAVGTFSGTSLSLRTDNAGGAGRSRDARAKMVHLACEEGGIMANSNAGFIRVGSGFFGPRSATTSVTTRNDNRSRHEGWCTEPIDLGPRDPLSRVSTNVQEGGTMA